ncbi:hypothetical protein SDC9_97668 [bioreactor metagenome]|uniref:Uncharacterized protein n=1 Tax=bioreactor metagenome TaxID=1076179 RepID=A0A645ACJ1_9ZZZZ
MYLALIEREECLIERLPVLKGAVSKYSALFVMSDLSVYISPKLGKDNRPAIHIFFESILFEIDMLGTHIPNFAIIPAACGIDGPAHVQRTDTIEHALGVKLSPTLVEDDPHRYARDVVQMLDHCRKLCLKISSVRFVLASQTGIEGVFYG